MTDRWPQAWAPVAAAIMLGWLGFAAADELQRFEVRSTMVEDRKAVYATVETRDVVAARARIGGTVAALAVDDRALEVKRAVRLPAPDVFTVDRAAKPRSSSSPPST